MIGDLAGLVEATAPGRRALVAVDGVDASGKTTLTDAVAAAMTREVVRASVDSFHRPRAERHRRGRASAEGCYRDTFDHAALRDRLLVPFRDGGACVTAVFDHERDRPVDAAPCEPGEAAVLVVDGVFLLRPELDVTWDRCTGTGRPALAPKQPPRPARARQPGRFPVALTMIQAREAGDHGRSYREAAQLAGS